MKLEGFKNTSLDYTKTVSDLVRQFALAGIAIIWIFKIDKPTTHLIPTELFTPILFLVATLAADLFQNLIGALVWFLFYRYHEKQGHRESYETKADGWLTVPTWVFWSLKILLLIVAYCYIVAYMTNKI